jgi:glycerate kinase
MRVLLAFDKCKGSLTAEQMCSLARSSLVSQSKDFISASVPLTDGGEGFSSILTTGADGEHRQFEVRDSLARTKTVGFGLCQADRLTPKALEFLGLSGLEKLAIVEMASVVGLADLKEGERNPWKTTTLGVGDLLREVARSSLGLRFLDQDDQRIEVPSPFEWNRVASIEADELVDLPPIVIACDVKNQLLGPEGATYQFGPQKGLPENELADLEGAVIDMLAALEQSFSGAREMAERPGTGAAGGIGFGLSLQYETKLKPGFSLLDHWFGLEEQIRKSDLILTGEGRFDRTSMSGKGPFEVIRLAHKHQKNCWVLAGSVEDTARQECINRFPSCSIETFGREDLSLEENFSQATGLFKAKLDSLLANQE